VTGRIVTNKRYSSLPNTLPMVFPAYFFNLETTARDKCVQNVIEYCLAGYDGVYFDKWILGFGLPATSTFSVFHYHSLDLVDNFIAVGNYISLGIYVFTC
jgi:hypothetical protein